MFFAKQNIFWRELFGHFGNPFKDQTHSVHEAKTNFATIQNLTFVLGRVFSDIMSDLLLPSVFGKIMIFFVSFQYRTCHITEVTCHLTEMTLR